jgi:hypothetical protein
MTLIARVVVARVRQRGNVVGRGAGDNADAEAGVLAALYRRLF